MAKGINIEADIKRAERLLSLSSRGARVAAKRAINKVAGPAKTAASKGIRKQRNLRAADIKRDLRLQRASGRSMTAFIEARRRPVPLHKFRGTRQLKKGLRVEQVPGQKSVWRNAFQPWGKGTPVFRRTGRSAYPIQFQVGPTIASALDKDATRRAIDQSITSRWPRLFRHEIEREIAKARRRSGGG